jgi:hypothetical protein
MNTKRLAAVSRLAVAATLVAASACAQAGGGVYWAVNVDGPAPGLGRVSTAVSNVPHGVYAQGPQVVYVPPPVYVPQPRVYVPAPPVYVPQPVVYEREAPRRCAPWWAWRERMHDRMHHRMEERMAWGGDRDDDRGGWDGRYDDHGNRGERREYHGR